MHAIQEAVERNAHLPWRRTSLFVMMISLLSGVVLLGRFRSHVDSDDEPFRADDRFLTADDYAAMLSFRQSSVPNGRACGTAADCPPGSLCAFPSWHNHSVRICCDDAVHVVSHGRSGDGNEPDSERAPVSDDNPPVPQFSAMNDRDRRLAPPEARLDDEIASWSPWLWVCHGATDVGEPCGGYDDLCASGRCINGVCATARLPDGVKCQRHGDCRSGACAFIAYDWHDDPRCCATGTSAVQVSLEDPLPYEIALCTGAAPGTPCGTYDVMCASGRCRQGICRDQTGLRRSPE